MTVHLKKLAVGIKSIENLGYSDPTPIQDKAISKIMIGKDVLGIAQTGTGKTGAFLIPIIHRLQPMANNSTSPARHPIRSIILAPTRELADQIYENAKSFTSFSFLRVGVVFGGVNIDQQKELLNKGVEILIATPGRLLDHLKQKNIRFDFVSIFTLDEADRMLDMGFLPDLQQIIGKLPKKRQSLLFSATFSDEIKKFSKKILDTNSELVQVSSSNSTAVTVDQIIYELMNYEHKKRYLHILINNNKASQILIFTNTKNEASSLSNHLQKNKFLTDSIHGNKTQSDRLKVLDSFKLGDIRIVVAPAVAARGLDIPEVKWKVWLAVFEKCEGLGSRTCKFLFHAAPRCLQAFWFQRLGPAYLARTSPWRTQAFWFQKLGLAFLARKSPRRTQTS